MLAALEQSVFSTDRCTATFQTHTSRQKTGSDLDPCERGEKKDKVVAVMSGPNGGQVVFTF